MVDQITFRPMVEGEPLHICSECGAVVADKIEHRHWHGGVTGKILSILKILERRKQREETP